MSATVRNRFTAVIGLASSLMFAFLAGTGCDNPPPYPERPTQQTAPPSTDPDLELHGFIPSRGLASDLVVLTGAGFSATPDANEVHIGAALAPVVAATETTLAIQVPTFATNGFIRVGQMGGWRTVTSEEIFEVRAPDGLALGYNGEAGQPGITSDLTETVIVDDGSTTLNILGGITDTENDGYWALLDADGFARSQGVLSNVGGRYEQLLPIFCGSQQLAVFFDNANGRAFHMTDVTRTECTEPSIRVKLSWDIDITDVDLHLLRPGGTFMDNGDALRIGTDCFFANRNPDWGEAGNAEDDPYLDVDDVDGFGPENIFLEPGENGTYTVVVHYYSDDGEGPSNAWVEVFIEGGRAAAFGPERLSATGVQWNVCTIDWPGGTVTPIGIN